MDCFVASLFAMTVGDGGSHRHCEPQAKQSTIEGRYRRMDCFVASLLAMTVGRSHARLSYRSLHCGFNVSISAIFFAREPPLICFSLAMASTMRSYRS